MFNLPPITGFISSLLPPLTLQAVLGSPSTTEDDAETFVLDKLLEGKFELADLYETVHIETKQAMSGLLKAVRSFGQLKHLDFSNTTFSDAAWEELIQNLHLAASVCRVTSIRFGNLTPARIYSLGSINRAFLNNLQTFTLEGDADFPSLLLFLGNIPQLSGLTLTRMSLRDYNIKVLDFPLTSLTLNHNALEDESVRYIMDSLKLGGLQHLNLEDNRITSLPSGFLRAVIKSNLCIVKLANNRLPERELQILFSDNDVNRDKNLQIDLYPQKVFPTPDYVTLLFRFKLLNIKSYVPDDVIQQRMQSVTPEMSIRFNFNARVISQLVMEKSFTQSLVNDLNKIMGNLDYLPEWNQFLEAALNIQFIVEDVPADGNCLFEAVGRHLQMPKEVLRLLVVQQEKANKDFYKAYYEGNFDDHLMRVAENQFWGGAIEIAAMLELTGRPLVIYNPANPLKLNQNKILPPGMCIHGELDETVQPIFLFNSIRPLEQGERGPGELPYREYHYKALFPKDIDRTQVCVWSEKFVKPPEGDTLGKLFTDESVSVENAIIRLWPLIVDKEIRIENIEITSLNGVKALCEWISPEKSYVNTLHFNHVTFSQACWGCFIGALTDIKSIRVFRYPNITPSQLQELSIFCRRFFYSIAELDLSGEEVDPDPFISPLMQLLEPSLRSLNLAGRGLGDRILNVLRRIPFTKVDLTRNGIREIRLPSMPENVDLRHNLIPAPKLLSFLNEMLEWDRRPYLFGKTTFLLPQDLDYSAKETSDIERALAKFYVPPRYHLGLQEETDILPVHLAQKFTIYEIMRGEFLWVFFSDLLNVSRKRVIEAVFAHFQANLSQWQKIEARPDAHVEEMMPILSRAFDANIVVHHATGTIEIFNGEKKPIYFYKDRMGTYYALHELAFN